MENELFEKIDKDGRIKDGFGKIEEAWKAGKSIYLYGAGNLAEVILKELDARNIQVKGLIVDSQYYGEARRELGLPVFPSEPLLERPDERNCIVIAFAKGYKKRGELAKNNMVLTVANPFRHHSHFDLAFVEKNREKLNEAYSLFEDEISRDSYAAFINSRIYEDEKYVLPCDCAFPDEFHSDVLHFSGSEVFLDVGAYNGGSIERFISSVHGNFRRIIGIEPEADNFKMLAERLSGISEDQKKLIQLGCWREKDRLRFNDSDGKCCRLDSESSSYIDVDTIDNLCRDEKVSVLNMGISIGECEMLEGAYKTISANHPKMIIFMGSAEKELYSIPCFIKENFPQYKLYLRFQSSMPSRLFLYAI